MVTVIIIPNVLKPCNKVKDQNISRLSRSMLKQANYQNSEKSILVKQLSIQNISLSINVKQLKHESQMSK